MRGDQIDVAARRAIEWTWTLQSRSGGFGTFEPPPRFVSGTLRRLQLQEVESPDVTGHAMELLATEGYIDDPRTLAAGAWLKRAQDQRGAWTSFWASNYIFGTHAALVALAPLDRPAVAAGRSDSSSI